MYFDIPEGKHSIIKVVGVGGGGSNAVTHMFRQGIVGVDFAICNTDNQAMELSPVQTHIQLGPHLTEGRGAGSKPIIGKQACIESIDDVRSFLSDGTKMLFVTAGMGGGTGTGAAPIIAKAAKEMDILTVGIVTLPFKFEGIRRARQAMEGLEDLKKNVDALVVISNEKLREIHGNLAISEAFAEADNILATAAKGIAEIITVPGYVNVDFEDVNTVMRDSGVAIMGAGQAEGEGRARKAVTAALNSPLLEDNDIRGAQHILLNITSGNVEITMDEISEITEYIQEEAGFGTDLIWGNCKDESLGEYISVTLIATGFEQGHKQRFDSEPKQVVVSLEDEKQPVEEKVWDLEPVAETDNTMEFDVRPDTEEGYSYETPYVKTEDKERMEQEEQKKKTIIRQKKEQIRNQNLVQLNNAQNIAEMESKPAYLRRQIELEDVDQEEQAGMSRYTVSMDEDGPEINEDNSFIHDNVD